MSLVRVVAVVVRVVAALVRSPKRFILKGPACIESSFLQFWYGSGLWQIVIFALWYGSGLWRIKTAHF